MLEDDSVDYDEIKEALLSRNIMSHAAAAEAYYSLDSKELLNLPMAQVFSKLDRWLIKIGEGAETEVLRRGRYAMGLMRSQLVPELKLFFNMSKPQISIDFEALVRQWPLSQHGKRPILTAKQVYGPKLSIYGMNVNNPAKKPVTCYHCGKINHMAKECWNRLAEMTKTTNPVSKEGKEVKPLVCFSCREVGHKSPQCPNKRKEKVKRIKILPELVECLAENDVMASVNNHLVSHDTEFRCRGFYHSPRVCQAIRLHGRKVKVQRSVS